MPRILGLACAAWMLAFRPASAEPAAAGEAAAASGGWYMSAALGRAGLPYGRLHQADLGPGLIGFDTGRAVLLAAGYDFGEGLRAEVEAGYGQSAFRRLAIAGFRLDMSGDVRLLSLAVNTYYDYENGTWITPYAGIGAGLAQVRTGAGRLTLDGVALGTYGATTRLSPLLQLEMGISFALPDGLRIGPAYRYVWVNLDGRPRLGAGIHMLALTVRRSF